MVKVYISNTQHLTACVESHTTRRYIFVWRRKHLRLNFCAIGLRMSFAIPNQLILQTAPHNIWSLIWSHLQKWSRYTFDGKPEKHSKSPGKPEKYRKSGRKLENAGNKPPIPGLHNACVVSVLLWIQTPPRPKWSTLAVPWSAGVTDCMNLGTHAVTNSLKPASPIWKTASYIQFHSVPHTYGTCMYHCIEYLYSHGKVFRTIVADNGAISQCSSAATQTVLEQCTALQVH